MIKGQITDAEFQRLKDLASTLPSNGLAMVIGAYQGKADVAILEGLPPTAHLVSIDPGMLGPTSKPSQGYETEKTLLAYRRNIMPRQQQVTQIIGWPNNIAKWWNSRIDLLFVDATKKYESIVEIWKAFFPFCAYRVASHDYVTDPTSDQYYPGVHRALEEVVFPNTVAQNHVDFTWDGIINKIGR